MVDYIEKLIIFISTPIYVVLILGEIILSNWYNRKLYTFGDTVQNLYLMLANMGVDVLMRGITLFVLLFFFDYHLVNWDASSWYYWALLFLAEDFIFYWIHRTDHVVRFFWAIHVTHHSSDKYNLTTGFRSSVFQPVYRFIWFIPLVFLGFEPFDIFIMYSITQTYGILVHTKAVGKLGFLEHFLVTPSHHRVHHASNVEYLDKNMGMILIVWDKLFGTFQMEIDGLPIEFGLYEKKINNNPVHVIFHEWISICKDIRKVKGIKNKWLYITKPPGWSHDGSTMTSKELREHLKQIKND
ncbi:sterol desaturase family protein [Fluviicola sp.]|jgi:sterol desaturase/sphingolipid hydroxylase (fatty acid hydroxylase superfamily)|uniref:sterol desaturase family protein n=1 Tax=Fluviicola sp. TaxID=1917219 RepID=UPI0028369D5E|nr:sterol desaturase family protein [Fluviicola sp.]MDR0802393.1 sterol desaturase family protein [Fluviicola sp.]